ncbi:hypothetical protein LEMLEM_LOCUS16217 [Lemmus lemmus]
MPHVPCSVSTPKDFPELLDSAQTANASRVLPSSRQPVIQRLLMSGALNSVQMLERVKFGSQQLLQPLHRSSECLGPAGRLPALCSGPPQTFPESGLGHCLAPQAAEAASGSAEAFYRSGADALVGTGLCQSMLVHAGPRWSTLVHAGPRWSTVAKDYGVELLKGSPETPATDVCSSTEEGEKRWKDLKNRVMEHDIRIKAKYHTRITMIKDGPASESLCG